MATEDDLRRAFEATREDVADAGFARRVVTEIVRQQRRRRLVLGVATAIGALITVPALVRAQEFIGPLTSSLAHETGQLIGVVTLSVAAISVWLLSLTAEG